MRRERRAVVLGACLISCAGSRGSEPPTDTSAWTPLGDAILEARHELGGSSDQRAVDQRATDKPRAPDAPILVDAPILPPIDLASCAGLGQGCVAASCCAPLACSGAGTTCCRPVGQSCASVADCCVGRACVLQKCCAIVGDGCSQDSQCCNAPAHQCQLGSCCVTASSGCANDAQCCSGQCQSGKCK